MLLELYLYICRIILAIHLWHFSNILGINLIFVFLSLQPESLGPLDLEMPSPKYNNDDFMLSDSLSGLNRLIASSLDAFQNCSFFGVNKKEATPSAEGRETASFSDFKIGNGV